jgi:hypothetical protein
VMIGVFLANARTVRFTHGSHCCVGAEQRQHKTNRRYSARQPTFTDTPGRTLDATRDFDRPKQFGPRSKRKRFVPRDVPRQ